MATLAGKRVAVLVDDLYQEMEFWYPYYRLKEAGATVVAVGPEAERVYKSKNGYPAKAERAAADVKAEDFDAVIIPGGYAPDLMRRNEHMINFVRDMYEKGKLLAAICHAGWVLVSAGVLDGKKATSFFSIQDDLRNAGAQWVDEPVVRDGNLITSRVPDDLPAFCTTIIEALSG
jgi:protease I